MAGPLKAPERIQQEAIKVARGEVMSENRIARTQLQELSQKEGAKKALVDATANRRVGKSAADRRGAQEANIYFDAAHPQAADQTQRRADAADSMRRTNDFLTKRYENVGATDRAALQQQALERVATNSWTAEMYTELRTPAQQEQFAKQLLTDPNLKAIINRNFDDRVNHRITDGMKDARAAERGISHEDAAGQLEVEWQASLDNVVGDSVGQYMNENFTLAEKLVDDDITTVSAELDARAGDQARSKVTRELKDRYARNNNDLQRDYQALHDHGLEGVLANAGVVGADRDAILKDPALRDEYEIKIAQMQLTQRLRKGRLKKDEFYKLADADWCGIDKLQEIVEHHKAVEASLKQYQAEGIVDKSFWEKVKHLSSTQRKSLLYLLLGGMLAPAIAMAGISGAGLIAAPAAMAALGGGVGAAYGAKKYIDKAA